MVFSKDALTQIKAKADILAYLESHGVAMNRSGTSWVGLCPVHSERSPSFHVKDETQTFRCFGCGISGDIIALAQAVENLSFSGAVRELSELTGIKLETVENDEDWEKKRRLYNIVSLASQWFRHNYVNLPQEHPAKKNLADRNLYDYAVSDETIGYAPSSGLMALLTKGGFTVDEMIEAGVVKMNQEGQPLEAFRNRLMWSITDASGRPIGFSGRKLDDLSPAPKYVNSPATLLYNKSRTLLGLGSAKKEIVTTQTVYVVEGQTDVMAMKAAGFINTVASCGTAFGGDHVDMLLRLSKLGRGTEKFKIVLVFDGDKAGQEAVRKVFEGNPNIHLTSTATKVRDPFEAPTDPCDLRANYGDDALRDVVAKEIPLTEYVLEALAENYDFERPEGVSQFLNAAAPLLSVVADPIQREAYVKKVAYWTGVPYTQLTGRFSGGNRQQKFEEPAFSDEPTEVRKEETLAGRILAAYIQYPEVTEALLMEHADALNVTGLFDDPLWIPLRRQYAWEGEFDFTNHEVAELAHTNLGLVEGREAYGIKRLLQGLMKSAFTQKQAPASAEGGIESLAAAMQRKKEQRERTRLG